MGKAEERCRVDCVVVCEESLIWLEGVPVVVCNERMAMGLFLCLSYRSLQKIDHSLLAIKNLMKTFDILYSKGVHMVSTE